MSGAPAQLAAALADRYRLERKLGEGGMATVFLAEDLRHDRQVAIKLLRPELAAVIGAERFLAEIKTTAKLQHAHILPLFDSGEAGGQLFYVMPFVEGESLRDRLTREKQLPTADAVRIAGEVASALDYAHKQGVIHRDIKPENIMLSGGHALVADFGIALAASKAGGNRMTETGLSLGTPHYMSPEQATAERELDARSDVYALGCVLYEMLAGEPPFTGPSTQAIIARLMTEDPRPLSAVRRSVPPHVEAAVACALEKLAADRFATAGEFGAAIAGMGSPTAGATALRGRGVKPAGNPRLTAALGGAALLGVALAAWGWLRPAPERPVRQYALALPKGEEMGAAIGLRLAISPDGARIVYVGPGPQGAQLWVRELDQLHARPLAGTDGAMNPAFSPDGSHLAFISGVPRAIRTMALAGGTVTTLTDSLVDAGGLTWGFDGYLYYDGHFDGDGIARIRAEGGMPEAVTRADSANGEAWHSRPEALPGGKGVLITINYGGSGGRLAIGVADPATGKHTVLHPGIQPRFVAPGHVLFVEAGRLLALPFDEDRLRATGEPVLVADSVEERSGGRADVAVSRTGTLFYVAGSSGNRPTELAWVDRAGHATAVDTTWRGDFSRIVLSPDQRRVAATVRQGTTSDAWIKPLDGTPASKLTFDGKSGAFGWSPDGREVYLWSGIATGERMALRGPWDGSSLPVRVPGLPVGTAQLDISRDGRWYAYWAENDIAVMPASGDTTQRLRLRLPALETGATLSPDGHWLAYASDESGRQEIYVRPFPAIESAKRQVSLEGGINPRWSADGRTLYYIDAAAELVAASVETRPAFTVQARSALFSTTGYGGSQSMFRSYEPSPDGRRFLMLREIGAGAGQAQLVVLENLLGRIRAGSR